MGSCKGLPQQQHCKKPCRRCHHTQLQREIYQNFGKKELISSEWQEQMNFFKGKTLVLCLWHLSSKQKGKEIQKVLGTDEKLFENSQSRTKHLVTTNEQEMCQLLHPKSHCTERSLWLQHVFAGAGIFCRFADKKRDVSRHSIPEEGACISPHQVDSSCEYHPMLRE